MKKILSLILVLVLALSCFTMLFACTPADNGDKNNDNSDNNGNNDNNVPATPTYSVAIAAESVALTSRSGGKLGNNFAVVVFDAEGKIVAASFDSTEISDPTIGEDGALVAQEIASKVESNYKKGSMAYTWGEQAVAFANFIKGKTAEEVAALDVTTEGLVAGCTMASTSYSSMLNLQALVVKAAASTKKVTFESATADFKLGAGMNVTVAKKWDNSAVTVTADCAGAVVGADGKVIAAVIDTIEQSYAIGADNALTLNTITDSKLALGDAYEGETPMAGGRWYNQIAAFANTAVGKTAAEVSGLDTENVTGCTINVTGHKVVLVKAVTNAQ